MKRIMIITAMLAAISLSLQAGPKVEMKTSGPSGQGNPIWWAPSTGITNLVMTTNGVSYLYLDGGVVLDSTTLTTNLLAAGQVLPAVDGSAVTNLSAAQLTAGTVLSAVDGLAVTNLAGGNIASGNIALARVTNAMATAGSTIGGNIPIASITNAAATVGASIGGNIPIAALTNAAGGGLCVVTNLDLDGTTNIITFIGSVQRNQ